MLSIMSINQTTSWKINERTAEHRTRRLTYSKALGAKPRHFVRSRPRREEGLPFNLRKFLTLGLFNESKRLDSGDVARALGMSRTSAASALLRYWRGGYLRRKRHRTGKRGQPYFVYSRTQKGQLRYNQYKINFEAGIPLNIHRYKPTGEPMLANLPRDIKLVEEAERDE